MIKIFGFIVVISNNHLLQLWFAQYSLFCLSKYFMCFFSFIFIFLFILSGISVNHFVVNLLYLAILFDILHQSKCFFFSYYFSCCFIYYFFILFHILLTTSVSSLWVFCIFTVTSSNNSSFTSFIFILPISRFFISLFLVFSLLLIFNLILPFTKKWSDTVSAAVALLTSQTFLHCLLSTNMWSIWLHILSSCDRQVTLWMSLCWYHVPITMKSFPNAKFALPLLRLHLPNAVYK